MTQQIQIWIRTLSVFHGIATCQSITEIYYKESRIYYSSELKLIQQYSFQALRYICHNVGYWVSETLIIRYDMRVETSSFMKRI